MCGITFCIFWVSPKGTEFNN